MNFVPHVNPTQTKEYKLKEVIKNLEKQIADDLDYINKFENDFDVEYQKGCIQTSRDTIDQLKQLL